jgi:hypothetical protein
MDMDISEEQFEQILRENAAPQMDPETATHTLREPMQSKRTWTCHKSNFMRAFSGKCRKPEEHPDQAAALLLR